MGVNVSADGIFSGVVVGEGTAVSVGLRVGNSVAGGRGVLVGPAVFMGAGVDEGRGGTAVQVGGTSRVSFSETKGVKSTVGAALATVGATVSG